MQRPRRLPALPALLCALCVAVLAATTGCQNKAKACRDACLELTRACKKLEGRAQKDCEVKNTPKVIKCMDKCGK